MFKVCALYWSLFVIVFSGAAFGDDNIAVQMAQMAELSMRDSCNDTAFLSCMGIKTPACKAAVNTALEHCRPKLPKKISHSDMQNYDDTVMGEWPGCVQGKMQAALKISAELMAKCDAQAEDRESQAMASSDLSPQQAQANLEKFTAAMRSQAEAVGTADVTLPIYKKSSVMSRMEGPHVAQFVAHLYGTQPSTQPAVTVVLFASPDSPDAITKFYKNSLKGFRQHKFADGVVFVEGNLVPASVTDLEFVKKLIAYQHVMVDPIGNVRNGPAGTKSIITIGFKK